MLLLIEQASFEDLEQVKRLNERTLPEHYTDSFWANALASFPEGFLVARDGPIVGYVMSIIKRDNARSLTEQSYVGVIASISIEPEHRRRGIASKLLKGAIEAMIGRNCNAIILQVRRSNISAIKFYLKQGFEANTVLKGYYQAPSEDGILMSKPLNKVFV